MIWSRVHRMLLSDGRFLALALLFALAMPGRAGADCTPRTHQSTCVDPSPMWVPAAPSQFFSIPAAETLSAGSFAAGLALSYASRPITLVAASPDPYGRDVRVVDDLLQAEPSFAASPLRHLELSGTLPLSAARTGTGLTGVTSTSGPELSTVALGDARLAVAHELVLRPADAPPRFRAMTRLELALPTGGAFAGSRGVTVAPGVVASARVGPVSFGAEQGARLRATSELGDARLGSQLVEKLGIAASVVDRGRLSLALEGFLLPSLVSQGGTLRDGTRITSSTLIPAEWMLSARSIAGPLHLQLGLGTALPLSGETRRHPDGTETSEHFAAMTSPRFRATLIVRYVPVPAREP